MPRRGNSFHERHKNATKFKAHVHVGSWKVTWKAVMGCPWVFILSWHSRSISAVPIRKLLLLNAVLWCKWLLLQYQCKQIALDSLIHWMLNNMPFYFKHYISQIIFRIMHMKWPIKGHFEVYFETANERERNKILIYTPIHDLQKLQSIKNHGQW